MLGSSHDVKNFGLSGSTVLLNTETPYLYNHQITNAEDFLPNIVIIMLGTNDARTDRFHSIANFAEDYKELIRTIKEFETKPEIFLVKPPPIFENYYNLESENFVRRIIPLIEQVAIELDLPIIDVYVALENNPEYFLDGVHPSSEGAYLIAEKIHETIILYDLNS